MKKEERIKKFKDIADAKGYKFEYVENSEDIFQEMIPGNFEERSLHLDLNMVDQSIKDAITGVELSMENQSEGVVNRKVVLKNKLIALLKTGSAYEKASFVYSSGTYYFPSDIEQMAREAALSENLVSPERNWDCETICYTVCRCLGTDGQTCYEKCRWACNGAGF